MSTKKYQIIVQSLIQRTIPQRWLFILMLVGLLLLLGAASALAGGLSVSVKGIEISPGVTCGEVDGLKLTCGVVFVGKPVKPTRDLKGNVAFTIRYAGDGQINFDDEVYIKGGFWKLVYKGSTYAGKVTGGTVTWPDSGTDDVEDCELDCGSGVACVSATLVTQSGKTGAFNGCLDDLTAEGTPRILPPPEIWGVITLP
jgi:hypothetical protein